MYKSLRAMDAAATKARSKTKRSQQRSLALSDNPHNPKMRNKDPGIPDLRLVKDKLSRRMQTEKDKEQRRQNKIMERRHTNNTTHTATPTATDADSSSTSSLPASSLSLPSRHWYFKELKQVIDQSDILLLVVDARDPLGCRNTQIEQLIVSSLQSDQQHCKRLILVLNKVDLIPHSNLLAWMSYLKQSYPCIAFKSTTQQQTSHLNRREPSMHTQQSSSYANDLSRSGCVGANALIQLLKNYSRNLKMKKHITVGVIGYPNVGKCFAPGTLVRLFNGEVIEVERVAPGMQLMGDDSTPRTVQPGSLVHGQDVMYRIIPKWEGVEPFTVNANHILVLACNRKPWVHEKGTWRVQWFEAESLPSGSQQLRIRTESGFTSREQAEEYIHATMPVWRPIVYEMTVREYLASGVSARQKSKLFFSDAVSFVNPSLLSIRQILTRIMGGRLPSDQLVEWTAWYCGLWITDGCAQSAWISQGGSNHQSVMDRVMYYNTLTSNAWRLNNGQHNQQVTQELDKVSSVYHQAYYFKFTANSIPHLLLRHYGLLLTNSKRVPDAWLCESIDIRRRILAGILDGDGYYNPSNVYELVSISMVVVRGYKTLAASLGFRNSMARPHDWVNPESGIHYNGWCINISGHMWEVMQYCALSYKQCAQPGLPQYVDKSRDLRCYSFKIQQLPGQGDYYGFTVDGNGRFLLADFSVTHNSSLINSLKRTRAVAVGNRPGVTKQLQEIKLDAHVTLIDSPGVMMNTEPVSVVAPGAEAGEAVVEHSLDEGLLMRNCLRVDQLDDPVSVANIIMKHTDLQTLIQLYGLPTSITTSDMLLPALASKMGKLLPGGLPNIEAVSRILIQDLNNGKIPYHTEPPVTVQTSESNGSQQIQVVSEWAKEFDVDALLAGKMEVKVERAENEQETHSMGMEQ